VLAGGISAAAALICAGEEQLKLGESEPVTSSGRVRRLRDAVTHYERAEALAPTTDVRIAALEALARLFDVPLLNEPASLETTLRALTTLEPENLGRLYRLAQVQESQGSFEAAEDILRSARQKQPLEIDPLKKLAEFYLRRATELAEIANRQAAINPSGQPGQPDSNGVFRVGESIKPPQRKGVPRMPEAASAAGVQGVVIVEVVIDESGAVTQPRILRSIPLLDDAALDAVREWRFDPTIVDGRAVPVRMTLSVNFTLR
jgi:protein TonB